jgi:ABC-type nitrate/sulfonate/bicarbonate transport system ATPase subunit
MSAPAIELRGIGASYDGLEVLRDLSLEVRDGELVSILGPSGSGKSTTFSVLTGALAPDAGELLVHGAAPAPGAGPFAYMPQQDALFPWRRVIDNLTLGLEVQGLGRREARARVAPLIEPFGLAGFEQAWPFQLSGGMRQRAALLRTVVQDRPVLLLDEPFGALDALTRTAMQRWLEGLWEAYRWTVLLVTHDVREAIFLSDRVEVFSARPARVVASVDVPFARPRSGALLTDPAFTALEARLLDDLLGAPA